MKPDKVSPLAKEDKEKDEKGQSTLSAVLSERRFSEVSSLASLQSGICRSEDFLAPTGAQGVKMSVRMCVCVYVCVTFFKREL